MADSTLIVLLDEVRRKTLDLLEDISDKQARFSPDGLQNSILWHAGHCYVLLEWLTSQAVGCEPTSPPGWFEMFGWNSRPAEIEPDAWPPLENVMYELRIQHGRIRRVIANLSEERLTSPALGRPDRTPRFLVVHALHDEACHGGEIWLLRTMLFASTH